MVNETLKLMRGDNILVSVEEAGEKEVNGIAIPKREGGDDSDIVEATVEAVGSVEDILVGQKVLIVDRRKQSVSDMDGLFVVKSEDVVAILK